MRSWFSFGVNVHSFIPVSETLSYLMVDSTIYS